MDADTERASTSHGSSDRSLDTASKRAGRSRHGRGPSAAPAAPSGHTRRLAQRVKNSVWAPVLAKAATVFAGMIALAAVGAASTLHGPGTAVDGSHSPDTTRATFGGVWLAAAPSAMAKTKANERQTPPTVAPPAETKKDKASSVPDTPPGKAATAGGIVVLNEATAEDLMRLPGVGAKRAEAILALRTRVGRFKRPTDLLRVRGIGPRSLKRMLPLLVVDAPKSAAIP